MPWPLSASIFAHFTQSIFMGARVISELNRYPLSQHPPLNFYLIYTTYLTYYNTHYFLYMKLRSVLHLLSASRAAVIAYTYTSLDMAVHSAITSVD